jgi:hypothetical protein
VLWLGRDAGRRGATFVPGSPLGDELERRIVVQDRLVKRTQRFARLEPELVYEPAAGNLVCLEGLRLTARAVQRQHQPTPRPLTQRVLCDQRFQLSHELRAGAAVEILVDSRLETGQPQILQACDLRLCESQLGKFGE